LTTAGEHTADKPVTHFDSLDGFRGLAALFILFFHSLLPWFRPLWIGVPMFFVLSGFLITRILITHKEAPGYLKTFYSKRALRIFPIYYLALFISVLWALLVHASFRNFPFFLFYLQNFIIAADIKP
jgi:peptidoglycan/LPS O-acetylase OafA/YrhL